MVRFIPDIKSGHKDRLLDTEIGDSLYVRVVEVFISNLRQLEYATKFGAAEIIFYPNDEIFEVPSDGVSRRKVLFSKTTRVDDIEIPSLHSHVVAVEERPGSNIYVACGHRGK